MRLTDFGRHASGTKNGALNKVGVHVAPGTTRERGSRSAVLH